VRHLSDKRCATDGPRYQEQRDRLAEVLACREPVVLFTQTASARSMRLAAKLGFTEVARLGTVERGYLPGQLFGAYLAELVHPVRLRARPIAAGPDAGRPAVQGILGGHADGPVQLVRDARYGGRRGRGGGEGDRRGYRVGIIQAG